MLPLPISRPMPLVGPNVHEIRLSDGHGEWRIMHQIRERAIYVGEVFPKKTQAAPKQVIDRCEKRFRDAD